MTSPKRSSYIDQLHSMTKDQLIAELDRLAKEKTGKPLPDHTKHQLSLLTTHSLISMVMGATK